MIVMEVDLIDVGKRLLTPSLMAMLPASGRAHDTVNFPIGHHVSVL